MRSNTPSSSSSPSSPFGTRPFGTRPSGTGTGALGTRHLLTPLRWSLLATGVFAAAVALPACVNSGDLRQTLNVGDACTVDDTCPSGTACIEDICQAESDGAEPSASEPASGEPDGAAPEGAEPATGEPATTTPEPSSEPGAEPASEPSNEPASEPAPSPSPDVGEPSTPPPACTYPSASAPTGIGDTLPLLDFAGAMSDGDVMTQAMDDFFCDPQYAGYSSFVFVLATEWCPNCPSYLNGVAADLDTLEANGAKVFFVDMQDRFYNTATHQNADTYFSSYLGPTRGTRIGISTFGGALDQIWSSVPNGFVVRRSDMAIIAHQEASNYQLNYPALTADPERDWGNGAGPGDRPPVCENDEPSEPNNTTAQAASLQLDDVVNGGVCDAEPDYFDISATGAWTVTLSFSHSIGDLDMEVLNGAGAQVGLSESATDDEEISGSGPATLHVYGWEGAQAPYVLTLQ